MKRRMQCIRTTRDPQEITRRYFPSYSPIQTMALNSCCPVVFVILFVLTSILAHNGGAQFVGKCRSKFFYKPNRGLGYRVSPCSDTKFAECLPSLYARKNCSTIPQPLHTSPFYLEAMYRGGRSRLIRLRVVGYASEYKSNSLERLFIEARKVDKSGRLLPERIGRFSHADSQCEPETCCDPSDPDLPNVAIECALPFSTKVAPYVLPEYEWTAPPSLKSASIQFIATFIQSSEKHWADVKSPVIKYKYIKKKNKRILY